MADNVTADAGSGGAVFATDDISSVHYPITKITIGALESQTLMSGGNGVTDAGTVRVTVSSDSTGVLSVDDNGGSLTVDGTVTANLSVTDNAVLDAINDKLYTINTKLVTGTVIGDVNLGATDNAVLDAIAASVAGTLTVGSHAVTNAGTFAVQADSVIPGTGATNLGKAADAAAGATDTGVATLAIRDDSLSALTPIEVDYAPLQVNSTGALHVTGAGGGTQYQIDDVGGATDTGTVALAIRDDSLTTLTPVDGDYVGLRVNSTGALHVTGGGGGTEYAVDTALGATPTGSLSLAIRDDALTTLTPVEGDAIGLRVGSTGALWTSVAGTVTVDGSGVTQPVSGTVTANLSATDNAVLDTIDAVLDTINAKLVTGTVIGDVNLGATDNAVLDAIAASVAGTLTVGSHAVTNAGTFAVQVDGAALTALQLIDNPIVAHDAAISGSTGVQVIGLAARDNEPIAVTNGYATRAMGTTLGKLVVTEDAIPGSKWSYAAPSGGITDTFDDEAQAQAGAGIRNYVTGIQVFNGHATVSTEVVVKDGSTIIWRGWAQAAGGGATFKGVLRGTADTAINVAAITTGSAIYFNLQGYISVE